MKVIEERLEFISFLKNNPTKIVAGIKSISAVSLSLIPIGEYILGDLETIDLLAKWRNINVRAYPTRFEATRASTQKWLQQQLASSPNKILFLVTNAQGSVVGHMGLASIDNSAHILELDNISRFSEDLPPNTFSKCLKALLDWAKISMYVEGFSLRVFSTNSRAIRFYQKNKFIETRSIPMMEDPSASDGFINLIPCADSNKHIASEVMLEMVYKEDATLTPESLILTAGPSISQYESFYAYDAAINGWNADWSKYLNLLEACFKDYIGVRYALATSSCTGAMHIALLALGLGEGDEIIVPDLTWVATANAVRYVNATPIFVDVNKDDWTINPSEIEKAITDKTKAIMPVHMYGHPANMEAVMAIAKKFSLLVIEDAAPSIGAEFKEKKTGSFGHFSAFSFQGAKLMVTGEGGMLLTDDFELYSKAKKIWDQGRNAEVNVPFWIDEKGLKYKMSNIQAAIGLGQLNRIETLVAMKRRVFGWYHKYLSENNCIALNHEPKDCRSIYWMSSIKVLSHSPVNRDQLINALRADNIDTRPVFPAISQYPIWQNKSLPSPNALHIGKTCINLPSGVGLSEAVIKYVCSRINLHTKS
ncbi:aminotransferase class I/II-fold pyridoxal phosphate-dependent enzyme [Cyanobium sp. HWJ4-Hawea]|uniref:bifunctional GNAT family N-acetyltransferase/PLP-dependent aspartate aminotransferase family protein n=1 Tax=Cyanobium sp. HWJ4-Hawea TaxID=2823713 RepID=UPI0020CD0E44|nr:bifunctional GNAT family N-acetyltransferase/PLP-dependent aspartate aminotransferase family protein [Cyanobium sp. HWJ4-Hawea]MCP9808659.1 aminotransferase class I/II-fold pyridoxal phosphate-dependent enzyme [Cyanobium sp. HWJ4-Hawea]